MNNQNASPISDYHITEDGAERVTLSLSGGMDVTNAARLIELFSSWIKARRPQALIVDLQGVHYLDDFGALVLLELKYLMDEGQRTFEIRNARPEIEPLIHFEGLEKRAPLIKNRPPGVPVRMGAAAIRIGADIKYMVSFIGSVFLALLYTCRHPRSLRRDDTLYYMQKTGVDAVPIVGLISFLLGVIIAFMSAAQLRQFSANHLVAMLVGMGMVKELGPIMTAIIVAGRSGSAFAAEIGTMRISDEIDALFTMGFDPTRFLVVPKIIASVVVVPLLTLFSDLFGILGGLFIGISMLDLTAGAYLTETIRSITLGDVLVSYVKSLVFAFLIAWIGCLRGFQVRGGAAAVGQATTSAVVSSIFLTIVADAVFAVIQRYW
ncbi:MAG: MlaE family lipid ABC transporter permease subunit [Desulfobacteraceae bacterium]|nr:MAG: MlaE family lipid ABC transporter permease subunit [Desulfobacteraceae bacterium]